MEDGWTCWFAIAGMVCWMQVLGDKSLETEVSNT